MENDEELPVRSPVSTAAPIAELASNQDENDWSTLLSVAKDINEQMARLSSVDALNLKETEEGLTLKEQIAANKKALEILEPIQATINSTIQNVNLKQQLKGGQ